MPQDGYQYAIKLFNAEQTSLGHFAVQVDWEPAAESVRLCGIRQGRLMPVLSVGDAATEPVWHPDLGRPYVNGFRVEVSDPDGGSAAGVIPLTYVADHARQAAADLVARGQLKTGEYFRYLVQAFPAAADESEQAEAARFSVEQVPQRLPLRKLRVASLLRRSEPCGEHHADDAPVLVPRRVLGEALDLTQAAGVNETGGILIGHLGRDGDGHEVSALVTAQVAARHTQAELTRLTFTHETWADVQAAIDRRGRGEIYLGWWHCHNFLKEVCKDCEKLRDGTCNAAASCFMSDDDKALHRAIFPRAYSVALVISDSPVNGLSWQLFGWRDGMIVPRGFHILGAPRPASGARVQGHAVGGVGNDTRTSD